MHIVESLCPGEHQSPGSPLQAALTQRLSSDPLFFSVSLYVLSVPVPRLTFAQGPAKPLHSRCCRNHLMEDDCRAGPGGGAVHRGNGTQEAREGQSREGVEPSPSIAFLRRLCRRPWNAALGACLAQGQRPGLHCYPLPQASYPAQDGPTFVSLEWLVLVQGSELA